MKDIKLLASKLGQQKVKKGLEDKMCEEWLRSRGLFSPEQRRLRGSLMVAYSSGSLMVAYSSGSLMVAYSSSQGAMGTALSSALQAQRKSMELQGI